MTGTFADLDNAAKAATARSLYAIYDKVAETFIGQIIIDRHPAPVCRMFHSLLGDKQTQLASHPADYNLLHVGYIEDSGRLWPVDPVVVATGSAWLSTQTPATNG